MARFVMLRSVAVQPTPLLLRPELSALRRSNAAHVWVHPSLRVCLCGCLCALRHAPMQYVQTTQLDGETNLKMRRAPDVSVAFGGLEPGVWANFRGCITCEQPTQFFDKFTGTLSMGHDTGVEHGLDAGKSLHASRHPRGHPPACGSQVWALGVCRVHASVRMFECVCTHACSRRWVTCASVVAGYCVGRSNPPSRMHADEHRLGCGCGGT